MQIFIKLYYYMTEISVFDFETITCFLFILFEKMLKRNIYLLLKFF